MKLLDRYKGALVGVHTGDSLGAPYEKMFSPRAIDKDIKERGGLTMFDYDNPWGTQVNDRNGLRLPAGRPTDDSDQTADLSFSLIACNGLNTDHLREALRDSVVHGKSRLWDGQATGSGTTTRNALSNDAKTSKINGVPMNNIGTNGSLMRCAPMALWFGLYEMHVDEFCYRDSIASTDSAVSLMSMVTHRHPHAITACCFYTAVLRFILQGADKNRAVLQGAVVMDLDTPLSDSRNTVGDITKRVYLRLTDKYDFPYDPGSWPMRGTAEFSLYVALYALLNTTSFTEGVELAVRVGGDTDTYAAIAGGLLGAYYGYDAIPQDWRNTILGHDVMVDYAQKLYEMRLHK